ncbi:hypothetical protein EKK58_10365 [Candidatus Dependentiae bacterium]|nr:MAG: hypothetical protein EKK58_10365 [Candidatus Dependentiae bacterium]
MKTKRKVCGVGINDSLTPINKRITLPHPKGRQIQQTVWACPIYSLWADMLKRCYSVKYKAKYPTYNGCSVCDEWIHFSNFRDWVNSQDWEGKELDKDILVEGNTIYSPLTCLFVTKEVNYLFLCKRGCTKTCLMGVRLLESGKYKASCKVGGRQVIGTPRASGMQAHNDWKTMKIKAINLVIENQTDTRVIEALCRRVKLLEDSILNNTEIKSL